MPTFVLSDALEKVLAAAGVTRAEVEELAAGLAAKYPDLGQFEIALRDALAQKLDPSLNAATIQGLVTGAFEELKSGHPGYDPHHFGGA